MPSNQITNKTRRQPLSMGQVTRVVGPTCPWARGGTGRQPPTKPAPASSCGRAAPRPWWGVGAGRPPSARPPTHTDTPLAWLPYPAPPARFPAFKATANRFLLCLLFSLPTTAPLISASLARLPGSPPAMLCSTRGRELASPRLPLMVDAW